MVAKAMIHNFSIHAGKHCIKFGLVKPTFLLELSKSFSWVSFIIDVTKATDFSLVHNIVNLIFFTGISFIADKIGLEVGL